MAARRADAMIDYDPRDWMPRLFQIRASLVREILPRVLPCALWAVVVVLVHVHVRSVSIPSTMHSLIGLALSLLLVFRTNASYDRFWEGRKLWGGFFGGTRNLVRSSEAFLIRVPEIRREIAVWMLAFVYATMHALRGHRALGPMTDRLDPDSVRDALASPHPAVYAANRISLLFQQVKSDGLISDDVQVHLDRQVQRLIEYLGGCERIRKTPVPFAYVIHLRRTLVIYCYTLPFALVDSFHWVWMTVPMTLFLAFFLFGIEAIGVALENPFGESENDLPLESFCDAIRTNTEGLLSVPLSERA